MSDMSDVKTEPATITVSGQEVKIEMSSDIQKNQGSPAKPGVESHDPQNRDSNGIMEHVKIKFEDLIAEPDTEIYSFDKIWTTSQKVYTLTKVWCYRITSAICAVPCAVCFGIYFACLAFCTSWCCMPCLKSEEIGLLCCKKMWRVLIDAFVSPCCDAFGRCLSLIRINVNHVKDFARD